MGGVTVGAVSDTLQVGRTGEGRRQPWELRKSLGEEGGITGEHEQRAEPTLLGQEWVVRPVNREIWPAAGLKRRSQAPDDRMRRALGESEKKLSRKGTMCSAGRVTLLHPLKGKGSGPGHEAMDGHGGEILLGSDRPGTTFQSRLLLAPPPGGCP